uniref:F-box/LRR-repeat protein At5g02910-like isoform X2 n=1 Tax=Erigeron canadensis TaxID=72917 RepID=UPI001CB90792|nr:F-box/LRR-repeat protein At5g02910-like isoform X2 [Erigeron canadensis]
MVFLSMKSYLDCPGQNTQSEQVFSPKVGNIFGPPFFVDYLFRKYPPLHHFSKAKPLPDFYMWVDKTLAQCQSKNLSKFSVSANYDSRFESYVNNWIRFATKCKVQHLHLNLSYKKDENQFVLEDDSFFINSHFTRLHLGGFIFSPTGPVAWNNLTYLSISNGNLDEHVIANILSGMLVNYYGYLPVDKTVTQCQSKNLYRFQARATYESRFESQVNNWIHFATKSKVQELDLDLRYMNDDQFVLEDESFFINSHFTHLNLECCLFNPTGPISWNNLTHLTISHGELDHDLIAKILSGSPLLDTLRLDYCYGFSRLDITSKSVKNLVFFGYDDDEYDPDHTIEINAPYILSLRIIGGLSLGKLLLRDVSSLVKAELEYTKYGYDEMTRSEEREEMLEMFILYLHHVKELKIGKSCYTAFSRLEAKGFNFPSNLKSIAATLEQVQTTQRVILSQLAALRYDHQRYQPLLERLAQEDARAAGMELAAYAPPQVMMPVDD